MGVYMGIIGFIWWYMGLYISMRLHLAVVQNQVYFWWGPHHWDYSIFVVYQGLYPGPPNYLGKSYRDYRRFYRLFRDNTIVMENQIEKNMERHMETGHTWELRKIEYLVDSRDAWGAMRGRWRPLLGGGNI